MIIVKIFACSLLSMLLGAAILGLLIGGFYGFIGAPVLMCFGWFYFPVILVLEGIAFWAWHYWKKRSYGRGYFFLVAGIIGGIVFSLIGIKEVGSEWKWTIAYAVSAFIAAQVSCFLISRNSSRCDTSQLSKKAF